MKQMHGGQTRALRGPMNPDSSSSRSVVKNRTTAKELATFVLWTLLATAPNKAVLSLDEMASTINRTVGIRLKSKEY